MKIETVRQLGDKVILIDRENGKAKEYPWYAARELAKAIQTQAQRAEEYALANKVAYDNAILRKAGLPFGLTNEPNVKRLTMDIIKHDKKLSKYMGSGVKGSQAEVVFGKPDVIVTNRRTKPNGLQQDES